jgi:hypothetical protein
MTRQQSTSLCVAVSILVTVGAGLTMRAIGYPHLTTGVGLLAGILTSCGSMYYLGQRTK